MWKREILEIGSLGYSDIIPDVRDRRKTPLDVGHKMAEEVFLPLQGIARDYYDGKEEALRNNGTIWTTSLNLGVNCAKKHLILRLWENDNTVLEYQW